MNFSKAWQLGSDLFNQKSGFRWVAGFDHFFVPTPDLNIEKGLADSEKLSDP